MTGAAATEERAPAWRGGFGRLWTAAIVSRVGDALRTVALPLLAVRLTDDPLAVAAVSACGYVPWLLFGLLGGAIADRVDQRRAMWSVDLLRALLVAAFALAVGLGHTSLPLLIALAFCLTALQTLFDNAATALLPSLVRPAELGAANARLMTGQQLAGGLLTGPFVPLLFAAGASMPFAADAGTFLAAAALVASLRTAPPDRAPRPQGSTLRSETAEGLRTLWRDPALRACCVATLLCNVGMGGLIATLVLHVTGWLHAGNSGYAAAMSVYAAGSIAGGFLAQRIARRTGRVRALLLGGTAQTAALLVMGSVRHLSALLAAMAVLGAMGMVWNVNQRTLMQQRAPASMTGRVSAAFRTASVAGAPLGALLAGGAARLLGLQAPVLLAGALFALAVVSLIPARRADVPVVTTRGDAATVPSAR
ncbi:MFS transporter [Streptomyces sp. NPDC059597]|uniref:MFS transporter n=1 Tax=Streptomyces sp. NPDC059597 TaxID=3346879 RepID=UPI0036B93365